MLHFPKEENNKNIRYRMPRCCINTFNKFFKGYNSSNPLSVLNPCSSSVLFMLSQRAAKRISVRREEMNERKE